MHLIQLDSSILTLIYTLVDQRFCEIHHLSPVSLIFLPCFDTNLLCCCRWWIIKPKDTKVKSISFNITFLAIERGFDFITVFSCPGGLCTEVARYSDHDATILSLASNVTGKVQQVGQSSALPDQNFLIAFIFESPSYWGLLLKLKEPSTTAS